MPVWKKFLTIKKIFSEGPDEVSRPVPKKAPYIVPKVFSND